MKKLKYVGDKKLTIQLQNGMWLKAQKEAIITLPDRDYDCVKVMDNFSSEWVELNKEENSNG